jgi:two-component system, OmpR family, response regulator ChvI
MNRNIGETAKNPLPPKVLLVTQNRPELATISQILLSNGYELSLAEDKDRALKVIKKNRPDLIICNTGKNELDGLDVFKSVRSSLSLRDIPFLFISEDDDQLPESVVRVKPPRILMRPFTREQLAITVQESLKSVIRKPK